MLLYLSRAPLARWVPALARSFAAPSAPLLRASDPAPVLDPEHSAIDIPPSRIADILKTKEDATLWIGKDSMVIDAVRKMSDNNSSALLVFDPAKTSHKDDFPHNVNACVGILTERDYLRKVVVAGRSSFSTPVNKIMTPKEQFHVLTPEDTVATAMHLMASHNIRNLPVVDANAMVAVLTVTDVVKALIDDHRAEIETLKEFISGNSHDGLP